MHYDHRTGWHLLNHRTICAHRFWPKHRRRNGQRNLHRNRYYWKFGVPALGRTRPTGRASRGTFSGRRKRHRRICRRPTQHDPRRAPLRNIAGRLRAPNRMHHLSPKFLGLSSNAQFELNNRKADIMMVAVGLGVGLPGGLLGVGGPVLAVPIMVVLGVPMLVGVALAQVQSIFIAVFATVGFAMHGAIDWMLALLVGVPLLIGTIAGWYLAQRINPDRLQLGLAAVLIGLGGYLLIGGGSLS